MGVVSDSAALLLADDPFTRIRFVPIGANGNAFFTFRAWDQSNPFSEGTAGGIATTLFNGGEYPFSVAKGVARIEVYGGTGTS